MALHSNLPIYKVAYELLQLVTKLVKDMPRDAKVSMGSKLRDECISMVVMIFRANVARNKTEHLLNVIEHVLVAELILRLSKDMHFIPHGGYAQAILLTDSIGKQANGWKNAK